LQGENLELSFKAWMCGGSIEIVQCSHVGHVFRKKSPYEWREGVNVLRKNSLRVAKVWMDDYAVFYNYATGFEETDYGDISERVELRKHLKCKDFRWYLKHVYPERKIPSSGIAYGQIQNLGYGAGMCLDGRATKESPSLTVMLCHGEQRSIDCQKLF
jgi:polypeptide N-acetylgalactosaminyltransferase